MHIIVSQEIESVCPAFVGAAVEAQVVNTPYSEDFGMTFMRWKTVSARN